MNNDLLDGDNRTPTGVKSPSVEEEDAIAAAKAAGCMEVEGAVAA
jgi:hypothetical protein